VPPTYRKKLSSAATTTYDGIPWALAFSEEQQMQEMEREMRMQQGANDVLTGGVGEQAARPAL
jgi:import receptor subunit TOM22